LTTLIPVSQFTALQW